MAVRGPDDAADMGNTLEAVASTLLSSAVRATYLATLSSVRVPGAAAAPSEEIVGRVSPGTDDDPVYPIAGKVAISSANDADATSWASSVYRVDPWDTLVEAVDRKGDPCSIEVSYNGEVRSSSESSKYSGAESSVCGGYTTHVGYTAF